ncbi:MAG TPA: dihydrofolate reductase family protein [Acidimicrobiia bacterium]|nr:dihydrofolate reductase family protein [Acidimicrobiia bacterium]
MKIFTRMCTSLDGFVTTPEGLPVQLAFDGWDAGALGFYEVQSQCAAVLMGRTTFEPALGAPHWPWGELPVFVLGGQRAAGTPDDVVVESDPARLLARLRAVAPHGDVHLIGGPRTLETIRGLGALAEVRLMVLPIFTGTGLRLTPDFDTNTTLDFQDARPWPAGVVELRYAVRD